MLRLRQVVSVCADLEAAEADVRAVLGLGDGYNDPGVGHFGLHNVVLPIGDTFFEIVSPKEEGTTAGRFLERQGGDDGYMIILQTDEDMDACRARMPRIGVRVVWQGDHDDIRGTHLHPRDVGGAILSIDVATPPASWRWAGPDWQSQIRTEVTSEVVAAELAADDPQAMAVRWAEALEIEAVPDGDAWLVELDRGWLRFVATADGELEGVRAFEIAANDAKAALAVAAQRGLPVRGNAVRMAGVEFRLV